MAAGASYVGGLRQRRIQAETLVLHGSTDTVADPRNARVLLDACDSRVSLAARP